jgi:hypothetical protein
MKNVFVYNVTLANIFTGQPLVTVFTIATDDPGRILDLAVEQLRGNASQQSRQAENWRAFSSVELVGFAALDSQT